VHHGSVTVHRGGARAWVFSVASGLGVAGGRV